MSSKLAAYAPSALAAATMTLFAAALAPSAHAVTITRGFAGLWHDSSGANRGFSAEVVDTAAGKQLNAYWITTDAAGRPVWIIGQGPIVGNRAVLDAVTSTSTAGSARAWGQLAVSFDDCSHGTIEFAPTDAREARGRTTIARLTDDAAQSCTGGISDDRGIASRDARIVQFFTNTGAAPGAHGRARFEERSDRTAFNVEVEHLPIGAYSLIVDGVERATLEVATSAEGAETEVEFRSPVEPGKILLDFDPRGKEVDIVRGGTTFLTELFPTEASGSGGGHGGGGQGGGIQQYNLRVEVGHDGPEMHARLEDGPNGTDFSVELEHVAIGSYVLNVGGSDRGTIDVVAVGGGAEGEIEFSDPAEPGHLALDFDPRGQVVQILQDGAVLVSGTFPTQPFGGGHGGSGGGGGGGGGHGGGDDGGGHGGGGDDPPGDDHGGGGHGGDDLPGDDRGGGGHGGDDPPGDDHGGGGHGGRH